MARRLSRLQRVKKKRETRQAGFYFLLAITVIIVLFIWGLPAFARITGLFFSDDEPVISQNDGLRPIPPTILALPEATPSGRLTIEGYAKSGVDVVLYLNNSEENSVVVDASGSFAFKNVVLSVGDNLIYAIAKSGDKESEKSKVYTVTVDNKNPTITVTSPEDGESYTGLSQRTAIIKGEVDDDVVSLRVGERVAILSPNGTFSVNYQLEPGEQTIELTATDKAGNQGSTSITLSWEE